MFNMAETETSSEVGREQSMSRVDRTAQRSIESLTKSLVATLRRHQALRFRVKELLKLEGRLTWELWSSVSSSTANWEKTC